MLELTRYSLLLAMLSAACRAGELLPGELPVEWGRTLISPDSPPTVSDIRAAASRSQPESVAVIRLHSDLSNHYGPTFSPDGQSLLFLRSDLEGGICKICVFPRLSDERPTVIYDEFLSYDHMPSWSLTRPTLLAFSSNNADNFQENIHFWNLKDEPVQMTNERDSHVLPSIRQDGNQFNVSYRHENELRQVTWSREDKTIVNHETIGGGVEATYSPDGHQLAVIRDAPLQGHQLFLHDRSTGQEALLTTPAGRYLRNATWSPDGKTLAFYSRPVSKQVWTLHILSATAGSSAQSVVNEVRVHEDFRHLGPSWDPDSEKLWYVTTSGEAGYYPLRWSQINGESTGEVHLPLGLLTASDVHCTRDPENCAVTFVAVQDRSLDVYVMLLNHF